jgi:hypothetical protein
MGQLVLRVSFLLILKFSAMFLLAQMLFYLQFKPDAQCSVLSLPALVYRSAEMQFLIRSLFIILFLQPGKYILKFYNVHCLIESFLDDRFWL